MLNILTKMKKLLILLAILFTVNSFAQDSTKYVKNRRTGLWDLVHDFTKTFSLVKTDSLQVTGHADINKATIDTLTIDSQEITEVTFTDSITTDIGNITTGVPKVCADTIFQNGTATVRIAISLADDETYNLPDAKNVTGYALSEANKATFVITTAGAVTNEISTGSVAATDSDGTTICVYDGGTRAIVKNRSGGALTFIIEYTWEY